MEAHKEILKNTAEVMDVSRISIWEIDEKNHSLKMTVAYNKIKNE